MFVFSGGLDSGGLPRAELQHLACTSLSECRIIDTAGGPAAPAPGESFTLLSQGPDALQV